MRRIEIIVSNLRYRWLLSQVQYSLYYKCYRYHLAYWRLRHLRVGVSFYPSAIRISYLMVNCNITMECLTGCILFEKIFNTADDSFTSTCSWHVIILWGYWFSFPCLLHPSSSSQPRSWELRTQKLKSHMVRTRSLNVPPLKPGVGQYIAIHSTLTARDFFLSYFYPHSPAFFAKPLPIFSCVGCGYHRFLCRPAE